MKLHVVVGVGPVGTATALHLAAAGETVQLVSRSGGGPAAAGVELVAADATDAGRLAATGPKGKVRAAVWQQALAAHQAGKARVTEARAADFVGPGFRQQSPAGRAVPRLLAGRTVRVLGNPDAPHSWTYIPDIAATLAALGADDRARGHAWHVPTSPPVSQREILTALARDLAAPAPRLTRTPAWALRAAGLVIPVVRELEEVRYQFDRPFLIDSSACQQTFGIKPTPMAAALAATATWWRSQGCAAPEGNA